MPTCYLLAASRLWHHKPVSPDTPLQRDAPYVQIIEHYRQQIRDGRLQDGDMLPSGREIAAEFGVSLATAAKVATGLQALGLVTPRPGAGTVVTAPRPPADRARGGPLLITLATRTPSRPGDKTRVLEASSVAAPQDVAGQLGIELPAQVVRRRQVVTRDGVTGYRAYLLKFFTSVRITATLSNPYGIHNQEWGGHVYVCTGPRHPWGQMWPRLRHYYCPAASRPRRPGRSSGRTCSPRTCS